MGVPTFYRWLCNRYPRVPKDVVDNYKDHKLDLSDTDAVGLELLLPNPNGEFDNLYLDMNGIIHPCCHPENMEQPESEEVMFRCILDYIDRIFFLVRPRKLIYLAIDGVAPRAKINQQRTRRFKSAAQADLEDETYEKLVKEYLENNKTAEIPIRPKKWDSNVITPGTEFMYKLSNRIVEYIKDRVERYDAWRRIVVIFSDSNVPGEGEHKIMKFIRNQRHCPGYDPNTTHVLHGMDADLIMLGLATHEPKFYIIREIVTHFINTPNIPKLNNNTNDNNNSDNKENNTLVHNNKEDNLFGDDDNDNKKDNKNNLVVTKTGNLSKVDMYMRMMRENWRPLQLLQLSILREYLSYQLKFVGGFDNGDYIDFERCIDDVVLMIFFCGNDFLPNLPSISITGGSIDQMILLYQKLLPSLNDYLSNEGNLNFKSVDKFFKYLSKIEDETFRSMHEYRMRFQNQNNNTNDNNNNKDNVDDNKVKEERNENNSNTNTSNNTNNNNNKEGNNQELQKQDKVNEVKTFKELFKETIDRMNVSDDIKPMVDVTLNDSKLWKKAYYFEKFGIKNEEELPKFVEKVSFDYIKGICWVLQYYYQGCASWSWYYPHHYSPFCSDLDFSCVYSDELGSEENLIDVKKFKKENNKEYNYQDDNNKEKEENEENNSNKESDDNQTESSYSGERGTKRHLEELKMIKFDLARPLTPFQQLMGVMPIRSSHCIPKQLRVLMTDPESPLRDFYPVKFKEDPNGKRYKYQWVALLPFIDEEKLLLYVKPIEEKLNDEEKFRNRTSLNMIFISKTNKNRFLNKINQIVNNNNKDNHNNKYMNNDELVHNNKENNTRLQKYNDENLFGDDENDNNSSGNNDKKNNTDKNLEVEPEYFISECNKKHKSILMKGVQLPPKVLTVQDVMEEQRNRGFNCEVAKRMILNMLSSNKELHYNEPNETVLKDNARDYHQYYNQYNPQQYHNTQEQYQNQQQYQNHNTYYDNKNQNQYTNPNYQYIRYQQQYYNTQVGQYQQQYHNQTHGYNNQSSYDRNYQTYNKNQRDSRSQYQQEYPNTNYQYNRNQQQYQKNTNLYKQQYHNTQGQYQNQYHNHNTHYNSTDQYGYNSKKQYQNNKNPNHQQLKRSSNEKYF